MANRATKQQIVAAILDRLIDRIDRLTAWNCILSDQQQPPQWPSGAECLILSVRDGQFPEHYTTGGGALTLCEQLTIRVTPWIQQWTRSVTDWEHAMTGPVGLMSYWKPTLLRTLLISEATDSRLVPWQPVDHHGDVLWRNTLSPVQCSRPLVDQSGEWLGLTLTFTCDYDWWL